MRASRSKSCAGKPAIVTLGITRVSEYESLEVMVTGSADGQSWVPVASFPPKCYCGVYTATVDLARKHRDIHYLRAEWKMGRWDGRGAKPLFDFYVFIEPLQMRVAGAA